MNKFSNRIFLNFIAISFIFYCKTTVAQGAFNWNSSPNNWVNSPNNFDNSPNNWVNSPNNFNNSPNNFSATNGVFDNRGNRIGYEVPTPSGVINYFDNSGNRIGYKPSSR